MDDSAENQKILIRLFAAFVAILIVLVGGAYLHSYISHRGKFKLVVEVVPADSQLYLDGKKTKAGNVYVTFGNHELKASRQYFDTVKKTVSSYDAGSGIIYLMPIPTSQEAKDWLLDHPDVQKKREYVGGLEATAAQKELAKKYPIINKLPVYNSQYKIDYSIGSDGKLSFSVTLFGILNRPSQYNQYLSQLQQYKAEALKFLVDNHIDPSKYKITYTPNPDTGD